LTSNEELEGAVIALCWQVNNERACDRRGLLKQWSLSQMATNRTQYAAKKTASENTKRPKNTARSPNFICRACAFFKSDEIDRIKSSKHQMGLAE